MNVALGSRVGGRATKTIASGLLFAGVVVGLIGFAHTPVGRPLLAWLASTAGCPVSLDGGDPIVVEGFRTQQMVRIRGGVPELARPAIGFELGTSTREQTLAQLGAAADCAWSRQKTVLRCVDRGLRLGAGVPIEDLYLQFNIEGVLVAVDALHVMADADQALSRLQERQVELTQQVGPPTSHTGGSDARHLVDGPLRQAAVEYHYRTYVARISATNWGPRGVRVREQYQWIGGVVGT